MIFELSLRFVTLTTTWHLIFRFTSWVDSNIVNIYTNNHHKNHRWRELDHYDIMNKKILQYYFSTERYDHLNRKKKTSFQDSKCAEILSRIYFTWKPNTRFHNDFLNVIQKILYFQISRYWKYFSELLSCQMLIFHHYEMYSSCIYT